MTRTNDRIQLHWQNQENRKETRFVEQYQTKDMTDPKEVNEWLSTAMEMHKDTCPQGWVPLVCNADSEYFRSEPS